MAVVLVFSIITLIFIVPIAFGYTISALVGQAIGSGDIEKARKTLWLCLLSCVFTTSSIVLLLHCYGTSFIKTMTDDVVIVDKTFQMLRVYTIFYVMDSLQLCMLSTIKALALQEKV